MFDNIEQLEKQVQEFQENILASNKLLADIEALTSAVKNQQCGYEQASATLIQEIKGYVKNVTNESETLRGALSEDINCAIQGTKTAVIEMKAHTEATFKAAVEQLSLEISILNTNTERFIGELKSADESAIDSVVKKLTTSQQSYIKQLEAAQSAIQEMNQTLNIKYHEFLQRLENINVDQLFKTCQDMKKSIEKKLFLLMGGVGITAIIAILSLLIR